MPQDANPVIKLFTQLSATCQVVFNFYRDFFWAVRKKEILLCGDNTDRSPRGPHDKHRLPLDRKGCCRNMPFDNNVRILRGDDELFCKLVYQVRTDLISVRGVCALDRPDIDLAETRWH